MNRAPGKFGLPFPLACPSFIYPDSWAGNLRRLAGRMDDVELLLFESGNLPSAAEWSEIIRVLRAGGAPGCTLTAHLPTDVFLGDPSLEVRRRSVEAVVKAIEASALAGASRYILHLDERAADGSLLIRRGERRAALEKSLGALCGAVGFPESLCIENLDFPLSEDLPLIEQFGLSVCLDVGHLIRDGADVAAAIAEFGPRLGYVHLHGMADRDHRSVAVLGDDRVREIGRLLLAAHYSGPVCLEVFNEADLESSIASVKRAWSGLGGNAE